LRRLRLDRAVGLYISRFPELGLRFRGRECLLPPLSPLAEFHGYVLTEKENKGQLYFQLLAAPPFSDLVILNFPGEDFDRIKFQTALAFSVLAISFPRKIT